MMVRRNLLASMVALWLGSTLYGAAVAAPAGENNPTQASKEASQHQPVRRSVYDSSDANRSRSAFTASQSATSQQQAKAADREPSSERFIIRLADQPMLRFETQERAKMDRFQARQQRLQQSTQQASAGDANPENAATSVAELNQRLTQQQTRISQQQDSLIARLSASVPGAQVLHRYQLADNSIAISIPRPAGTTQGNNQASSQRSTTDSDALLRSIGRMPNVAQVFRDKQMRGDMHASKDFLNIPEAWSLLSGPERSGEGVRVAVIDSGINPNHPMFQSNGHSAPTNLPGDDYCATVDPSFCNDKLIIARHFNSGSLPAGEVDSPLDINGHGSHVAGTAVGNPVQLTFRGNPIESSGMAPGAYLMVYKALYGELGGQSLGWSSDLIAALNAAVADGADIINNSWGSGAEVQENSAYYEVFNTIEEAGVLLVTSAGNSGVNSGGVGCPACVEAGLAVASSDSPGEFNYTDPRIGDSSFSARNITPYVAHDNPQTGPIFVEGFHMNGDFCTSVPAEFVDEIAGSVVIVSGTQGCDLADKVDRISELDAAAVFVYDHSFFGQQVMQGKDIPVVVESQGGSIEGILRSRNVFPIDDADSINTSPPPPVITGRLQYPTTTNASHGGRQMSSFSSRGPVLSGNYVKPDVTASGGNILSAVPDTVGGAGLKSGTSMAAPHVSGIAALVKQLRPELNARELKQLLSSTALPILTENNEPARINSQGHGLVSVLCAMEAELVFEPVTNMQPACPISCRVEADVVNISDQTFGVQMMIDAPGGVQFKFSQQEFELAAGERQRIHVDFDMNDADPFAQNIFVQALPVNHGDMVSMGAMLFVTPEDSGATLANYVTSDVVRNGVPFSARSELNFFGYTDPVRLTTYVPENTSLVTDSVRVSGEAVEGELISVNQDSIVWEGSFTVGPPTVDIAPASFEYNGKSLLDVLDRISYVFCEQGCDDIAIDFDVSELGQLTFNDVNFDVVWITDNGYLTAGQSDVQWNVRPLPDSSAPGNMIAPVWHDFYMTEDSKIFMDFVDERYAVVEWQEMASYEFSQRTFDFAVWMDLEDNKIYFNYLDTGELVADSSVLVVGAQDATGSNGMTYPHSVNSPQVLGLTFGRDSRSFVTLDYDLVANTELEPVSINAQTQQGEAVTIDMATALGGDDASIQLMSEVNSILPGSQQNLFGRSTVPVVGSENLDITILSGPQEGDYSMDGNLLTYTPDIFFFGMDRIEFSITDLDGAADQLSHFVNIEVEMVMAPPVIDTPAVVNANGGDRVRLGVDARDIYGHTLRYQWQQVGGSAVNLLQANSAEPEFNAPYSTEEQVYTFMVEVSNDEYSSSAEVDVVVAESAYLPPEVVITVDGRANGQNQTGSTVRLDGSASTDPLGHALSFSWRQISGPTATLSGSSSAVATLTVPAVEHQTNAQFELTVSNDGASTVRAVSVTFVPASSSSSMSLWLMLLFLPLLWIRRRVR
ncbi:MAG: S8 family serine peptidase [Idiomarina sp.]|nr:S8 family serine peptidase [Idiomarina sp.]